MIAASASGTAFVCSARPVAELLGLVALLALLAGCASSRTPESEELPPSDTTTASTEPSYTLLYHTDENTIVRHALPSDEAVPLASDVDSIGAHALSPNGRILALSYATADSTHLALIDPDANTLRRIHAHAGPVTYSLAWHPDDDQLAFAYYTPVQSGTRGPGDVRIAQTNGSSERVGCQAAREVLHWFADGTLATRDDDNLYLVDATDCATQASVDARRVHHATYSADGQHLAYIHRELNYDRSAGAYRPDSSLYVSAPDGDNAELLFGNERQIRHLRWAPETAELAFSAHLDDAPQQQVVIYNADRAETVFLTPPAQAPEGEQLHPRWSPSGSHLAFTLRTDNASEAYVRIDGQTRNLGPSAGPVAGWLDDRTLVLHGPDRLRLVRLRGDELHALSAPTAFIHGWMNPKASGSAATDR